LNSRQPRIASGLRKSLPIDALVVEPGWTFGSTGRRTRAPLSADRRQTSSRTSAPKGSGYRTPGTPTSRSQPCAGACGPAVMRAVPMAVAPALSPETGAGEEAERVLRLVVVPDALSTFRPLSIGGRSGDVPAAAWSADSLPEPALCARRVLDDLRRDVKPHHRPPGALITRPSRIGVGDKAHSGSVHLVGERLRRVRPKKRFVVLAIQVVEHKR
jgi:hypothetical protein